VCAPYSSIPPAEYPPPVMMAGLPVARVPDPETVVHPVNVVAVTPV
jgi:hypothetical protein